MSNPFKRIQEEYDNSLNQIAQSENSNNQERYLNNINNFMDIKREAANLYNQMRNDSIPLDIPQLQNQNGGPLSNVPVLNPPPLRPEPFIPAPQFVPPQYNVAYPQFYNPKLYEPVEPKVQYVPTPTEKPTIFVNDIFTGVGDPSMNSVRNVVEISPEQQKQQQQEMQRAAQRAIKKPGKCFNSSFSNMINQAQFLNGDGVVSMQADNGNVYQFNNGNRANAPICAPPNIFGDNMGKWSVQNAPTLGTVTKEQYQQNLAVEFKQQQEARNNFMNYFNSPLNNPNNPVWKPMDSKYLN